MFSLLWRPRNRQAIPIILESLERSYQGAERAFYALFKLGNHGKQAILDNLPHLKKVFLEHDDTAFHKDKELARWTTEIPEIVERDEFLEILRYRIEASNGTLNCLPILIDNPSLVEQADVQNSILSVFGKRTRLLAGVIRDVQALGLLEDQRFRDAATKAIKHIANDVSRGKESVEVVCETPLLLESRVIQKALTKAVSLGQTFAPLYSIPEFIHSGELRSAIAESIDKGCNVKTTISRLSSYPSLCCDERIISAIREEVIALENPVPLIEALHKNVELMGQTGVLEGIGIALKSFWSKPKTVEYAYQVDYDTYRWVWEDIVYYLSKHPHIGEIEDFQRAMHTLALKSSYPSGILRQFRYFHGLSESEVARRAYEQLIERTISSYDLQHIITEIPEKYRSEGQKKLDQIRHEEQSRRMAASQYFEPPT